MIDLKAWAIHVLGGVTAEEWEAGLRLPRPIARMLADTSTHIARDRLESVFRLGHYHHADTEAAKSVWLGRESDAPHEEPSDLTKMAENNAAFRARNHAYGARFETREGLPIVPPVSPLGARHVARIAERRRAEERH